MVLVEQVGLEILLLVQGLYHFLQVDFQLQLVVVEQELHRDVQQEVQIQFFQV